MNIRNITQAYAEAKRRILFLDYDGTLTGFRVDPLKARPSIALLNVLKRLTNDPRTMTVIVTGREHDYLSSWFNDLPLAFAAEHGCFFKEPGQPWQAIRTFDESWKPAVRTVIQRYIDQLPGSFMAEKSSGLVWHYRGATNRQLALHAAAELTGELEPLIASLGLRIMPGKMFIEVQPRGFDKGTTAQRWLRAAKHDFILAAGDDNTDEDLFRAMPKNSFTLKVGSGESLATHRLDSPTTMLKLLGELAKNTR